MPITKAKFSILTVVFVIDIKKKLFPIYSLSGMQCCCGTWVTPAFQIHKNRVDESWNAPVPNKNQPQPS